MKNAVRQRWLKALRSREYKQGGRFLCLEDGSMSCLGVLYDIEFDGYWELVEETEYRRGHYIIDGCSSSFSDAFADRILLDYNEHGYLLNLGNDSEAFNKAVAYIEGCL